MFGLGKLRFRGPDRKIIEDEEHVNDYNTAETTGRVNLGKLCLYYRDLGKKYYVPYDYIDRAFCRISECQPDDSPAYYYYRLILMHGEKEFANLIFNKEEDHGEKEFANLIFNKEEDVDLILEKLKTLSPTAQIGYIPPADGKQKARFM